MIRSMVLLLTLVSVMVFAVYAEGTDDSPEVDNTPIRTVDLEKYLGQWYEIARFDHGFERGVEFAKAEYSLMDNGKIKVVNSGIRDGKVKASEGKAKTTDTDGLLRVSFFGPFYSDYRILMLDDDYRYALVGSGSPKYLWILSRTPRIPDDVKASLLLEARLRGYDVGDLIWVKQ